MENNQTEFYKEREFGEIISTPITFFAQEFKLIVKSLLLFVGPFILLEVILSHYLKLDFNQDILSLMTEGSNYNLNSLKGYGLLFSLLQLLRSAMMYCLLGVYIKLYILSGRGTFGINDLWDGIKKFYLPVFVGNFVALIMIVIGVILILLPGLYIGVVMSILIPIIIFEDEGVGKAITRTFEVMKGNWWITFGAYVVMYILIFIAGGIIAFIIGKGIGLLGQSVIITSVNSVVGGLVQLLVTSIIGLLPFVLYTGFTNTVEKPELISRINQISEPEEGADIFEKKDDEKAEDLTGNNEEKIRYTDDNDHDRFKPKY
jgi:hypothetical protein